MDTTNMTIEQLQARIAELEAAQRSQSTMKLTLKVTEKGGVSVYGLQRFPVTLYQEQWGRLFANAEAIKRFIEVNKASLKVKGQE